MMKRKALWSFILAFLLALPIIGTALAAPPLPSGFYGTAKTTDGANLDDGTQVTAWINGTQYVMTATQTYNGESWYAFDVSGDDPDTPGIEGGVAGDTITFQIGGQDALETATWASGSSTLLNLTVDVDDGPYADFTCTPVSGSAPLEVTCQDESTGNITGWSWDFGDGTTSTDQNPAAHTYNANGSYTVSLTVTGPDGSDSDSLSITVSDVQDNVIIPLISAGDLAVDWASVIFPQTSLAGQDVLAYAIDETWTISDTTNLGAGWHMTIIADDHLRGSGDPTNRVINVGTSEDFKVSCLDSEISTVSGDNANLPGCPTGSQAVPIAGESPLTMLTADAGDGMGVYDFVPHFQLLVPGTTIIDTYTTNIFVDAIAGP